MPARLGTGGDPVHGQRHDVADLDRVSLGLVLGDVEDTSLGVFEQVLGGEVVRVALAEDLVGALDQLAANRLLADDVGAILGVGRVWLTVLRPGSALVSLAADRLELVHAAGQLLGQR